jgi:hypothetical protein
MLDRGVGAGDPLSLQSASSSNPKIGNITFTITHHYQAGQLIDFSIRT